MSESDTDAVTDAEPTSDVEGEPLIDDAIEYDTDAVTLGEGEAESDGKSASRRIAGYIGGASAASNPDARATQTSNHAARRSPATATIIIQ